MSTRMLSRAMALLLGTVALSGCAEWQNHMQSKLPSPQPAYANKTILVAPERTQHAIVFARNTSAVSADEQAALTVFLTQADLASGSVVKVEQPATASSRVARLRAANVTTWLRRHGYATEPFAVAEAEDGLLHVQVEKLVAVAPDCPNWDVHPYAEFSANQLTNLGCADRTNLAAMIANPADLVRGDEPSAPFGQGYLNGEQRYRTGEVTEITDAEAAN